jgi:hypothetical protein
MPQRRKRPLMITVVGHQANALDSTAAQPCGFIAEPRH